MSKLSDEIKNNIVKKTVHDKLAAKVNNIHTSPFILKTKYQKKKKKKKKKNRKEKKIPDIRSLNIPDFVKKTNLNELEDKFPDVSSLETKTALTAMENKIPGVSSLVKKRIITQKLLKLKKTY